MKGEWKVRDFVYPAVLRRESGGALTVTFPDFPEAITSGTNRADALTQAADCLQEAIAGRMVRKENVPSASRPKHGYVAVRVALYLAPKLALYLAMRAKHVNNSQLAGRLGVTETVVRRMLNPKHDTKPEKLQEALESLGKRVLVAVEDAA
jgi:antitoxin HicB